MRYYIDTEFLEGTQRERFPISLFRKNTPPTIDLISIGIVAEDGREYYAISKDFNLKEAWSRFQMKKVYGDQRNRFPDGVRVYWIRENVLQPIFLDFLVLEREFLDRQKMMIGYAPSIDARFSFSNFNRLLKKFGKTNKEIAEDLIKIVSPLNEKHVGTYPDTYAEKVEFYAYYADYDWVAFCWLFGKMVNLPKGFPMYCRDLKQIMDEEAVKQRIDPNNNWEPFIPESLEHGLKLIKSHPGFPKQQNEHSAIDDARWNKKLHEFLEYE